MSMDPRNELWVFYQNIMYIYLFIFMFFISILMFDYSYKKKIINSYINKSVREYYIKEKCT